MHGPMIIHVLRRPDGEEIGSTYVAPGNWPDVRAWIDEMTAQDADLPTRAAIVLDDEDENGFRLVRARGEIVAVYHRRTVETRGLLSMAAEVYRGMPLA